VLKQIEVYQEERQEDLDELYEKAHEIVRDAKYVELYLNKI
jgi:hypothetical protein